MRILSAIFAVIALAGCASGPQHTTPAQFTEYRLPFTLVARCPAITPTTHHVMDLLRYHDINPFVVSSAWSRISVPDAKAAEAREILSRVAGSDGFTRLEIIR